MYAFGKSLFSCQKSHIKREHTFLKVQLNLAIRQKRNCSTEGIGSVTRLNFALSELVIASCRGLPATVVALLNLGKTVGKVWAQKEENKMEGGKQNNNKRNKLFNTGYWK